MDTAYYGLIRLPNKHNKKGRRKILWSYPIIAGFVYDYVFLCTPSFDVDDI